MRHCGPLIRPWWNTTGSRCPSSEDERFWFRRRFTVRVVASRRPYAEALAVFEQLGMQLWAARARAEMTGKGKLTTAEQRVARMTASGMTNSEVAAAPFVSPKTVEFHLAGIYWKLGIRSRAELGRHVSSGRF